MEYLEYQIEKLKKSDLSDYQLEKRPVAEPFLRLCMAIRSEVPSFVTQPFAYFEKAIGNRRLLGFRSPGSGSYVIYKCVVRRKKGREDFFVKIVGLKGPESMAYLNATVKRVIPFFKEIEQCYSEEDMQLSSINTMDLCTGAFRRKDTLISAFTEISTIEDPSLENKKVK